MRVPDWLIYLFTGKKPQTPEETYPPHPIVMEDVAPQKKGNDTPTPQNEGQNTLEQQAKVHTQNTDEQATGTIALDSLDTKDTSLQEVGKENLTPKSPTPEESREALLKRYACITSIFEVDDEAWKRKAPNDTSIDQPLRDHAPRFYVCPRDKKDGLTIGYGTFFTKSDPLIQDDEDLLDMVQFATYQSDETGKLVKIDDETAEKGYRLVDVPVDLSKDEKRKLIRDLLQAMGTRTDVNQDELDKFLYHITPESADALLLHRIKEKNADFVRLIGDKKGEPILEWVATDLHYQGKLGSDKLKSMLRQNKLIKDTKDGRVSGYLEVPQLNKDKDPDLRQLGRRVVADYYNTIKVKYPFSPLMSEEEKKAHADALHKYVAAYAGEVIGAYGSKHTRLATSRIFIKEMASLGSIQIERDRLGRDLTPQEIQKARETAVKNSESYYLTGTTPQRVQMAKKIVVESKKLLAQNMQMIEERKIAQKEPNASQKLSSAGQNITQNTPKHSQKQSRGPSRT